MIQSRRQSKFISEMQGLREKCQVRLHFEDTNGNWSDEGLYTIVSRVIYEDPAPGTGPAGEPPEIGCIWLLENAAGLRNRAIEIDEDGYVMVYGDTDAEPAHLSSLLQQAPESLPPGNVATFFIRDVLGEKSDVFEAGGRVHQVFDVTYESHVLIYRPVRAAGSEGPKPTLVLGHRGEMFFDSVDCKLELEGRALSQVFTYQNEPEESEAPKQTGVPASPGLSAKDFEVPSGSSGVSKGALFLAFLVLILAALAYFRI